MNVMEEMLSTYLIEIINEYCSKIIFRISQGSVRPNAEIVYR